MKRLMVDMDDVITFGGFFRSVCKFLGEDIDINTVNTYFLQELLGDRKDEFWKSVEDENFYQDLPLMDGCYEVLEKLNKHFDIYIVTAYLWDGIPDVSGKNLKNKYHYLKENLPFIDPSKYIFTTNKSIIDFDIRIDDRLHNLDGAETKILFDQWHNRNIGEDELVGVDRVYNWYDIYNLLKDKYKFED